MKKLNVIINQADTIKELVGHIYSYILLGYHLYNSFKYNSFLIIFK